ncbi:CHAT domain-containing protein [Myxococcus sp. K15C18031901]|uniref:CHAT domain-containing protein n=1 Tax=Myxococcus dinghuensis TaxID=2906761 RepID=UPI0020A7F8E1|nr:CHAT domain-containing protein [Myxococcus dinghuensis]MCP3098889.1 CHAT domain-containing protein [Myxococcus dinghuensis]
MSELCDRLESFIDGELAPVDAENFRHHLTRCHACETRMKELLALELLADDALNAAAVEPAFVAPPPSPFKRRRTWMMVVPLALAAGLAAWVLVTRPASSTEASELWLGQSRGRVLEARLTHPGADTHRPYQVMRSGGDKPRALSLRELAKLEEAGDDRGIASAYLLRGDTTQAGAFLDKLPDSPDQDSDRAALALQKGAPEEALALADKALKARPGHPQALWNRALALETLGLSLQAAEAFDQVAAQKEPGWSEEAAERAGEMRRQEEERRKGWKGTKEDCDGMVSGGAVLASRQVETWPGLSRLCLYDALRTAPSAQRVQALRPLALQLDRIDGGTHLVDAVDRASRADFAARRPLSEAYLRLTRGALKPPDLALLISKLRDARQEDLLLGALLFTPDARLEEATYRQLAQATRDPWFAMLAEERESRADLQRGQPYRARERLTAALKAHCGPERAFNYRCVELQRNLSLVELQLHHPVEARAHGLAALERARAGNEWTKELRLIQELGQVARAHSDLSLTRAYLEETLLRIPERCQDHELAYTNLALAHYLAFDFAGAREQLDRAARCGQPPSLARAFVMADLAHTEARRDDDAALLTRGLEELRASASLAAGEGPMLRHIEGRFVIEQDRARGQALLRQSIAEATPLLGTDVDSRKARVYSFTSLILDAARHGEHERALALFAEERGLPVPGRCVLGVTVDDERTALVARDAGGRLLGYYASDRRRTLTSVEGLVPARFEDALRGCAQVDVLARPPVLGQAGLLAPDIAWTYRVSPHAEPGSPRPERRLVVADVNTPVALRLPSLRAWRGADTEASQVSTLKGAAATPTHVLEAMRDATEVQIHAHGVIDPSVADGSLLVLSPEEEDGNYALTATAVQAQRLAGHPVVLLAACHAAHSARYFHETFGLPVAFVDAGARAVLAATQEIPDAEASEFFEPVLARIRAGLPAALALRDARQDWLRRPGGTWVSQVLLFE